MKNANSRFFRFRNEISEIEITICYTQVRYFVSKIKIPNNETTQYDILTHYIAFSKSNCSSYNDVYPCAHCILKIRTIYMYSIFGYNSPQLNVNQYETQVYVAYIYIIIYVLGMANYYENNSEYAFAQLNFSFISVIKILAPFNGR